MIAFFGLVYWESGTQYQNSVVARCFFSWWLLCLPVCLMIVTVFVLNIETKTVLAEVKNNQYSP